MIKDIIGTILLVIGSINILIGVIGSFKFKFVLNRMHSAAIIDSLGFLFACAGLMCLSVDYTYILKLLLLLVFWWISSPITSHMVARLELEVDKDASKHMEKEKL